MKSENLYPDNNDTASSPSIFDFVLRLGKPRVLVVGDVFLERYTYGVRQQPGRDAVMMKMRAVDSEVVNVGGAASCAAFMAALGAKVEIAGIVGDDANGRILKALLAESGIQDDGLIACCLHPTGVRDWILERNCREPSQLLQLDRGSQNRMSDGLLRELQSYLAGRIPQCDAVVICDRKRGVCDPKLTLSTIALAAQADAPVLVEPRRTRDYSRYTGATLLRLNRSQAERATRTTIVTSGEAGAAGQKLCERYKVPLVVITMGSEGLILNEAHHRSLNIVGIPHEVYDARGAGYAVMAGFAVCLAAGTLPSEAGHFAMALASMELQKRGEKPVLRQELVDVGSRSPEIYCVEPAAARKLRSETTRRKMMSRRKLLPCVARHRARGERIVLTVGAFKWFHAGHLAFLQQAATYGDVLVVAIDSDNLVRRTAGADWPVVAREHRAAIVAALECVDYVLIDNYGTNMKRLLRGIYPDVLVKGGGWSPDEVPGKQYVEGYGGKVRCIKNLEGFSTLEVLAQAGRMIDILRAENERSREHLHQAAAPRATQDASSKLEHEGSHAHRGNENVRDV